MFVGVLGFKVCSKDTCEPDYAGYSRVAVDQTMFDVVKNGILLDTIQNTVELVMGVKGEETLYPRLGPAAATQFTFTHLAFFHSAFDGAPIYKVSLVVSKVGASGDLVPFFDVGGVSLNDLQIAECKALEALIPDTEAGEKLKAMATSRRRLNG